MRGQGLDCENGQWSKQQIAHQRRASTAIVDQLGVCSAHSSSSQTVMFAVQWILLFTKHTFVLFYIVNRGQLEFVSAR